MYLSNARVVGLQVASQIFLYAGSFAFAAGGESGALWLMASARRARRWAVSKATGSWESCRRCRGSRTEPGGGPLSRCYTCGGSGLRYVPECTYCNDTGEIETDNNGPIVPCPICQQRPSRKAVGDE